MNYSIDYFTCTVQGVIAIETQDKTLSEDELAILQFVNSYNHSYNKETLLRIDSRFRQMYESVNLTRLVVLKYLTIKERSDCGERADGLLESLSQSHASWATQVASVKSQKYSPTPVEVNEKEEGVAINHTVTSDVPVSTIPADDTVDPILKLVSGEFLMAV